MMDRSRSVQRKSEQDVEHIGRSGEQPLTPGLPAPQSDVLALQRAAGNQAVSQLLGAGGLLALQPKLPASQPGDLYEQEADRVAGPVLANPGRPLEPAPRQEMERHFGRDFGEVRVHTGGQAARSAEALGANAYTVGQEVVFGDGQYAPETPSGSALLAHELAHTVQQRHAAPGALQLTAPDAPAERRADAAVRTSTPGQAGANLGTAGFGLARQPKTKDIISRRDEVLRLRAYLGGGDVADDDSMVALKVIQKVLTGPFTEANMFERRSLLTSAVSLLEPEEARVVRNVLTKKSKNPQQDLMRERFGRLSSGLQNNLLGILESKTLKPPSLPPGLVGYTLGTRGQGAGPTYIIVRQNIAIADVAHYISDDPRMAEMLADLNKRPADELLPGGTRVVVPLALFTRPAAQKDLEAATEAGNVIGRRSSPEGKRVITRVGEITVELTETEQKALAETQANAQRWAQLVKEQKENKPNEAEQRAQWKRDQELAKRNPGILPFLFGAARVMPYFKDPTPLIQDPHTRFHTRTGIRAHVAIAKATRFEYITEPIAAALLSVYSLLKCMVKGMGKAKAPDIVGKFLDNPPSFALQAFKVPAKFAGGTVEGIVSEVKETIETVMNFDEFISGIKEMLGIMFTPEGEEVCCALGRDMGEQFAAKITQMADKDLDDLAYALGKLIGPSLVFMILPFAAIAGAVVKMTRLAALAKKGGRLQEIIERLTRRNKGRMRGQGTDPNGGAGGTGQPPVGGQAGHPAHTTQADPNAPSQQTTAAPSITRTWDDPNLTENEALGLYRQAGVRDPLPDDRVLELHRIGMRFNPQNRRWERPDGTRKKANRAQKRPELPVGKNVPRAKVNKWSEPFKDKNFLKEQQDIMKLHQTNPQQAGNLYQDLVARDHIGGKEIAEKLRRQGRRPDMGVHEFTVEGMYKGFGSSKLDQLWDDLAHNGDVQLSVPRLSGEAKDQLERLLAQARGTFSHPVYIFIRETLP